ncbi:hypothetical protein ACOMHN_014963 [Nucella lapillus]
MEHNVTIPVIYALLPDKTRRTYSRLFELLQQSAVQQQTVFLPIAASMGFERPCIQAFRTIFPAAEIHGCLFHFSQCIWRKTQEHGLAVEYKENADIRRYVRRLAALSFVPLQSLDDAWLEIAAGAPIDARITRLTILSERGSTMLLPSSVERCGISTTT